MIKRQSLRPLLFGVALLMLLAVLSAGFSASTAQAATNTLTLSVISARSELDAPGGAVLQGDPVMEYKYLINVDNTGDPTDAEGCSVYDAGYPDSCDWPSVREVPGAAPIYTQGDHTDIGNIGDLPPGKYLISILADGYKTGGAHFTVPLPDPDPVSGANVVVGLQPHPLPSATMRIRVFEDKSPINGQFDAPGEFGLVGAMAVIKDPAGDVTTDVFGNPLCTEYVPGTTDISPTNPGTIDCLFSDANGDIAIPNLGPNRYDVEMVPPPDGTNWVRTTTLEGSWSWDSWLAEGGNGLDYEFVVAGEPFPWTIFGYVNGDTNTLAGGGGGVKGTVASAAVYLPQQNGLPYQGGIWGGLNGTKVTGPIEDAWVALSDLQNGDTAVYVGQAQTDGTFNIPGVPDGNYLFTWWDNPLHHILDWTQITVSNGQVYDMGTQMLTGWFTRVDGYVFNDLNRNGKKDAGENGIANYLVGLRDRDNSEIDRMSVAVTTGPDGYYVFERAYPMSSWMVLEAYNDRFYTTGITYQVENQPTPTTHLGGGVDVGVLPILGQGGRLDWGVHAYGPAGVDSYITSVLADGPLHYYRLEEPTGSATAVDQGTTPSDGNYGTAVTSVDPGLLATSPDKAAGFDGTVDSYVDTGVTALSASAFSVEAWASANDTTGQHRIVVKDEVGVPGEWLLWFNQGKLRFQVRNSSNTAWVIAEAPTTPNSNTPFHVVGVFNGADAILYLDGVEVARTALGTATANSSNWPITIGADSDATNLKDHIFDGTIDEVAIYDYALSAARIQAHNSAANTTNLDPRNGGIAGSVFYEVTRNELVPQHEAVEPWSVGIPGLTMNLYASVPCTPASAACDANNQFEVEADGAFKKGALLNTTTTEVWEQPTGCTARDANGVPLPFPDVQEVLPPYGDENFRCLEGPLMGTQFQNGFASLDGNWGFGDGCFGPGGAVSEGVCADGSAPVPLPANDYLVEVETGLDARGLPAYQVTSEETVNVFGGDQFIPAVPPPACAGAMHTVDVAGIDADGDLEFLDDGVTPNPDFDGDGPDAIDNPSFAEGGGSPFEGMQKPLCETKLVTVNNGKSIAPVFTLFTDVPIPGKWKGYIIDDLSLSVDKTSLTFGEKAGMNNTPIGVYDFNNQLITTLTSDYNGTYEVLLPASHSVNCPSPSGVCASMYYILGNDPGQPGALNPNYNPQYRTIGATFEVLSGQMTPSDLAPTQMVVGVLNPSTTQSAPADCSLDPLTPQLFAVSRPFLRNGSNGSFTIQGRGFGTSGSVTLGDIPMTTTAWSDTEIVVSVAAGEIPVGPYQLAITNDGGESTINGLTFHYLGSGYNPQIYKVGAGPGPNPSYPTIQAAVEAASVDTRARGAMVIVYPGVPELWNPFGHYLENVVINKSIKLQGVGPGGVYDDGTPVLGSVIDGRGATGDTGAADAWRALVQSKNWDGNQNVYEGPVIYILAEDGEFEEDIRRRPFIDGLTLQGGDQQGFPGAVGGDGVAKEPVAVQGGGIFANAYVRHMQISNNVLQSNGGAYAGAIRLGTPHLPGALNDNQNDFVRIANNRIQSNGGTNLAGAIGIFSGSEGYEVANNDICGNFSAEYGGGISHYGLSPNGSIHHNRITFNRAYDEGGGVMIAGELPADPAVLSTGAGAVDVYANLIQANLGNDDGGGLRFLMAGNFPYNVYNNIIVNNISTHEGGGVSLNDAPDVRFFNNTVMKNITTATAVTSNGSPAPAGLSSSRNSATLQLTLPAGSPIFSDPLLYNNIFWDNRAGSWNGAGITGIDQPGDPGPINHWDLGVADCTGLLAPTYTLLQTDGPLGCEIIAHGSNIYADPMVVDEFDVSVQVLPWRGNPNFVDPLIVALETRVDLLGDFHLAAGSPAINVVGSGAGAPADDYDRELRPADGEFDIGADEVGGSTAPPNQPPVAVFTFACTDLACDFDASASYDPDPGDTISYAWDFGDGNSASIVAPNHTFALAGTYAVQLTVTDDGAVPASNTVTQEIIAAVPASMHLAGLDSNVVFIRPGAPNERWDAIVTILVHDNDHLPLEGAKVTMKVTRIRKANGNDSINTVRCTTDASGQCDVVRRVNPQQFEDDVTFELTDLTNSVTYEPADNEVATTIIVHKP